MWLIVTNAMSFMVSAACWQRQPRNNDYEKTCLHSLPRDDCSNRPNKSCRTETFARAGRVAVGQSTPARKQAAVSISAVRQDQERGFPACNRAGDGRAFAGDREDREPKGQTNLSKHHRRDGKKREKSSAR